MVVYRGEAVAAAELAVAQRGQAEPALGAQRLADGVILGLARLLRADLAAGVSGAGLDQGRRRDQARGSGSAPSATRSRSNAIRPELTAS